MPRKYGTGEQYHNSDGNCVALFPNGGKES